MKAIIYGAGIIGNKIVEKIKSYENIDILGYIDRKKKENVQGYPVWNLDELEDIDKNIPVIISVNKLLFIPEIYQFLRSSGFKNIYYYLEKDRCFSDDFLEGECYKFDTDLDMILPYAEMQLIDYCNLNCKGCAHYSPIFEKVNPDADRRIEDVRTLSKIYNQIPLFHMMGGEPLLSPDLKKYIEDIRRILPNSALHLVTNGLLIPKLDEDILQCIVDNKVIVYVTEYAPTHKMMDKIIAKLEQYKIDYRIRDYDIKQKFYMPLTTSDNSVYPPACIGGLAVNIWEGKIARCPVLMYIGALNERFNVNFPTEGIMELNAEMDGMELFEKLKERIPLCDHCVKNEIDWQRCGKDISLSDFAVDN